MTVNEREYPVIKGEAAERFIERHGNKKVYIIIMANRKGTVLAHGFWFSSRAAAEQFIVEQLDPKDRKKVMVQALLCGDVLLKEKEVD